MGRKTGFAKGHTTRSGMIRVRFLPFCLLAIASLIICCLELPISAKIPVEVASVSPELRRSEFNQTEPGPSHQAAQSIPVVQGTDLVAQGKAFYEASQYGQAARTLEQATQLYRSQKNPLRLAATLANLSLTYQQLGAWEDATQAVSEALDSLTKQGSKPEVWQLQAQILDVQGRLLLAKGDGEAALRSWQQAEALYQKANDANGLLKVRLNQAQAMRSLGFSRRALDQLSQVNQSLQAQADSREKAIALRALGDALQISGDLLQSEKVLTQSLQIAQRLQSSSDIGAAWLSLGNTARAQKNYQDAVNYYQQAASVSTIPLTRVQAQLNQLSLLIDQQERASIQRLLAQIPSELESLPASRTGIYAQINFAQTLLRLTNPDQVASNQSASGVGIAYPEVRSQWLPITLQRAIRQARELSDQRAESYALGTLGTAYEQTGQWSEAKQVSQQALMLAQATNTWDIAYRWQWQLGRLLREEGNTEAAIVSYEAAIANLKSLRGGLAATNPDIQFNFRDSVEPIYRQAIELLLQSQEGNPGQETLNKAREHLESLQLAELDNFFREACLEEQRVLLDDVVKDHPTTAILYPIVLRDRQQQTATLQVITKIPAQNLKLYTTTVNLAEFDTTLTRLSQGLLKKGTQENLAELRSHSQKVYRWLIEPIEPDLQALNQTKTQSMIAGVNTLVFILDDSLRSIPMSLLWDGEHYLVEKYSIALSLGLQLFDPKPIARQPMQVLAAGLSDPPQGFERLPYVQSEIKAIARVGIPVTQLLNQDFTSQTLENKINAAPFNVVHLATHGKFSSRAEDTFILAADRPINVTEFDSLLRSRDVVRPDAIQLLVLSACETATNDNRATLGLAGFAVRAGARSTLASLYKVSDQATSLLIARFYKELSNSKEAISKAEALRRAQVALLHRDGYENPRYWAPYVLIGNWL